MPESLPEQLAIEVDTHPMSAFFTTHGRSMLVCSCTTLLVSVAFAWEAGITSLMPVASHSSMFYHSTASSHARL